MKVALLAVALAAARPLTGIPVIVKDMIHVEGLPTTIGLVRLAASKARADAPVVARLRAAGAIILSGAMPTGHAENSAKGAAFGLTLNPYDPDRSAMGSSGGWAVAVAAGRAASAAARQLRDSYVGAAAPPA